MSNDQKTITPTLFDNSPAVSNTPDGWFYVFNGISLNGANHIRQTWFSGSVWGSNILVGQNGIAGGNPALPMTNGLLKSIVVGSQVFVVYQSSQIQLSAIAGSTATWNSLTTLSVFTQLTTFELFTDGSSLYVLVVDGGILKYSKWNGTSWDQPTVLTGTGGSLPSASAPASSSPLTAVFYQNQLRILYASNAGIIELTQSTNVWTYDNVIQGDTGNYQSLRYFLYNNLLWFTCATGMGGIDVYWWATLPQPRWNDSYMSESNVPAAVGTISVGVMNSGIFICYKDASGNLQIIWNLNQTWNNGQLTGQPTSFLPSGQAAKSSLTVCVWNNAVFNVCYVTNNNQVNDVFWYFSWNQTSLYPSTPSGLIEIG